MASFYFDGNKRRIYEVPTGSGSNYTLSVDGYRIYTPVGTGEAIVRFDVQRDLWSRFQDYVNIYKWSTIAFTRSGGNFRGYDELGNPRYQTNDFNLLTSIGWKIVLANYKHEVIFRGNLFTDDGDTLFDIARLTAQGIVPRIEGYDSFQTYEISSGGGGGFTATDRANLQAIKTKTDQLIFDSGVIVSTSNIVSAINNSQLGLTLDDIYTLLGFKPGVPLTASTTLHSAGGKKLLVSVDTVSSTTTITRNDA